MEDPKLTSQEALQIVADALRGAKGKWYIDGRPWVSWGLWLTMAAVLHASLVDSYPWIGLVAWLGAVAAGVLTGIFLSKSMPKAPYVEAFWTPYTTLFGIAMGIMGFTLGIHQIYWLIPSLAFLLGGFTALLAGTLSGEKVLYFSGGLSMAFHVTLAWPGWAQEPSTHMWIVGLGMFTTVLLPGLWLIFRKR